MNINKTSNVVTIDGKRHDIGKQFEDYSRAIDRDLDNLYLFAQGRVRFGNGGNNTVGENVAGKFIIFTSSGTADAENKIVHSMNCVPVGYIVVNQDKAGSLYAGASTWNTTDIYVKSSVASITWKVFLIK